LTKTELATAGTPEALTLSTVSETVTLSAVVNLQSMVFEQAAALMVIAHASGDGAAASYGKVIVEGAGGHVPPSWYTPPSSVTLAIAYVPGATAHVGLPEPEPELEADAEVEAEAEPETELAPEPELFSELECEPDAELELFSEPEEELEL
jgi:hypothetical protein